MQRGKSCKEETRPPILFPHGQTEGNQGLPSFGQTGPGTDTQHTQTTVTTTLLYYVFFLLLVFDPIDLEHIQSFPRPAACQ